MDDFQLYEVTVPARDLSTLSGLIGPYRTRELTLVGAAMAEHLRGRSVLQINSTPTGGGVAEMLQVLLPYVRHLDIDTRWLVMQGDPEFFAITKRLHNHLYGSPGDGGPLGPDEAAYLQEVGHRNAAGLNEVSRPEDVVVLHDPQPAGMAEVIAHRGLPLVWRCHVGVDEPNEHSERGWEFLRPLLEPHVDRYVFTRAEFAPAWVPRDRLHVIPPSIDPGHPKNCDLSEEKVMAVLSAIGLVGGAQRTPVTYRHCDGTIGRVEHFADVFRTGPSPDPEAPLVVQISRWDRMKDMAGVMEGFARWVVRDHGAHLVLAGPNVTRVADDPEGGEVLREYWEQWRNLPHAVRSRVQLVCLPVTDSDENATMVNALQRHASVVVQKSLAEGFGLTVAEAMLKGRPVVASRVGGIVEQIEHERNGLLLDDPTDLDAFGDALARLIHEPDLAERLGATARRDAIDQHLGDRHLLRWAEVVEALLD
jgi:trehalose synthase